MPRDRQKLAEIAQRQWCSTGEQIVWAVDRQGHVGSTIGAVHRAPHPPLGQVPDAQVPEPAWPLPTSPVGTGRFCLDEWAHDPAIWGWAHAQGPAQTSVRWADLLTAGRDESWLLLSSRRLAIVIESGFVATDAEPAAGLLGRVRSRAPQPTAPLTTWWEAPVAAVRRFVAVPLGRLVQPEWFVRVEFGDGSAFDFREAYAEQSVRTAYLNF